MGLLHLGDQLLFAAALLPGADHDGRAVRVVGTDVDAAVAAQLLEADPNVGLEVLDQVAEMDGAIGIRQGTGNEDPSHGNTPAWRDCPDFARREWNCPFPGEKDVL